MTRRDGHAARKLDLDGLRRIPSEGNRTDHVDQDPRRTVAHVDGIDRLDDFDGLGRESGHVVNLVSQHVLQRPSVLQPLL